MEDRRDEEMAAQGAQSDQSAQAPAGMPPVPVPGAPAPDPAPEPPVTDDPEPAAAAPEPVADAAPAGQAPAGMPPAPGANPWNGDQSQTQSGGWWDSGSGQPPTQPPAQGQVPAPAPKKSNTGLIVGIIVGVIALAAIFAIFVMPNLSGPSTPAPTADVPAADVPAPAAEPTEDAAIATVEAELDRYVAADPDVLEYIGDIVSEGFENQMDETLEACGVDPTEYASIMLEGFSYDLGAADLSSSGYTADVEVTIDCRDIFDMLDKYNAMFDAYINSEEYQTSSYDEDLQRVGIMFLEAARQADMNGGYTFYAELEWDGSAWEIDEDSWEEEMDLLFDVE